MNAVPIMIAVAPNGARKTHADHAQLPISPQQLAHTAWQCQQAGACMIHLHVRDQHLGHSLSVSRYREAIAAIRQRVGKKLIIQVTTESVGIYNSEQQMAMVRALKPEAVSLAIKELCPTPQHEAQAGAFFAWLQAQGILAQYILYSVEDVQRFEQLRQQGVIPTDAFSVLFVLGRYGAYSNTSNSSNSSNSSAQRNLPHDSAKPETGLAASNPADLAPLLESASQDLQWWLCAFGASEQQCMLRSAELGGHCRVGFENNLQLNDGSIAPDNAALISQLTATLPSHRPPASAEQAREFMSKR
ncbi:MAG: class III aminotransferase [SAR86 cluster bacterium]|uniref:Class III aminotransferase n=1 Tax=SAR86 cluster bacterium TaxID=2030880 RepID=A0A2A4MQ11_9GAMM|nr:MAG: class III aminotransferase [SAR86 cluster bacterium]